MPIFVKNLDNFWKDKLLDHNYARKVYFDARNFEHLDRNYYPNNRDYIFQSFNEELDQNIVDQFKKCFDIKEASVSWTLILPNTILPTHKDSFYTLREKYKVELDDCFRYLVFLEDWVFGQYVGFENTDISRWKAGDVWKFTGEEFHYGINASNFNFHSCQVSSFS